MDDILVVNASPIIFLGNAGRLDLLRSMGPGRVVVPDAVFREVSSGSHSDAAATSLTASTWIERGPDVPMPVSVSEWDLGPGESSVIATALRSPHSRAIIDDLNGRRCGLALGVRVMGTVGVVLAAHRRGAVEDPRSVLLELRSAGMWLSDEVLGRALRIAGLDR